MTKWKGEIDRYIGEEQKFTPEIKDRILRKASKRSFNWRYAFTAVSFCAVVLILLLAGPSQVEPPVQSATPFDRLIEEATVEEFFISSKYSQRDQFFARDSSYYTQVHAFTKDIDVQNMNMLLQDMKLMERPYSYGLGKDVLVVMSNGEQLKLKISNYDGWYIVEDVHTKLFYKLEDTSAVNYSVWDKKMDAAGFGFVEIVMLGGVIIVLAYIIKYALKIPKQKEKEKMGWKGAIAFIVTVVPLQFYSHYLQENEYLMHKSIHFFVVTSGLLLGSLLVDKVVKTKNQQIYEWIGMGLVAVFLWIVITFG